MDLLCPQPPLTCSSYHDSTLGPLIPVVAACVKDARPSRWLAPLERPRWPQQRPRVAPPAKPSLSAVELVELAGPAKRKKETKDNPREGWEDGTPPPHRDLSGAGEEFV